MLPLLFVLKFPIDVSLDELEPTLVKLLEQRQHRAKDVLVAIVVIRRCLICIREAIGTRLPVVRLIMGGVERHQAAAVCHELTIVGIASRCVDATIPIGHLLAVGVGHLVLTIIVSHVIR